MHLGDAPGEMPPPSINVGGPVARMMLGGLHTCVMDNDSKLRCWGSNQYGQLGLGHTNNIGDNAGEMPPPVIDVGGPIDQLAPGRYHSCALLDGGQVRCWGRNHAGQLGQGHTDNIGDQPGEMPPPIVDVGGPVAQLAAGAAHTCALMVSGAVRCWGNNYNGALGLGDTNNIGDGPGEMPPPVVNVGVGTITQIAAGHNTGCVLFDDGTLRCWGYNGTGVLGQGHNDDIGDQPGEMPPPLIDVGGTVVDFVLGIYSMCALLDTGAVRCWGSWADGILGYGNNQSIGNEPGEMPPADLELGGPVNQISHGHSPEHLCAVL